MKLAKASNKATQQKAKRESFIFKNIKFTTHL